MKEINLIRHPNNIVEVKLNRPEKKNSINFSMIKELIKVGKNLAKEKNIKAIILTGGNEFFSSGIDVTEFNNKNNFLFTFLQFFKPGKNAFQKVNLIWREIPIPVIAAINGYCFGAGFQLVLGADFRIATQDSKFSIMEAKWGLIPDMGITVSLRGLMPIDKAKELAMTARIFDGKEAKELGLLTYLDANPFQKAMELAKEISNFSPDAVAGVKYIFNSMVSDSNSDSLYLEKKWQRNLAVGKNRIIAFKKAKDNSITFKQRFLG
ncbi:MAG: crotonase/enoyl-CoA hydratase family protein [Solirubrobacteraceae bacterium]